MLNMPATRNDYVIDFRFDGPFNQMIIRVTKEDKSVSRTFENFTDFKTHTESEITSILEELMAAVDKKLEEKKLMKSKFTNSFGVTDKEEMDKHQSRYGNSYVGITVKNIMQLVEGRVLFYNDGEYVTFISFFD